MFIPIILKQSRNFNASPLSPLFRSKNCPLRQWPIRNFRSKYGTMTEQLASNSLPHVELNNRLLSVPIRCFEIPVSTRGKLETFPTRAHHSIRAEIHLEIRNYRGDLRIPRPIVRPLLVLPPPHPFLDRRRRSAEANYAKFSSGQISRSAWDVRKFGDTEARRKRTVAGNDRGCGEKIPVVEAACWKKTRRSQRWGNQSGWGKIVGGKVSLNNYAA